MAIMNPLRYRGYYYDAETGFYYLQIRYYDPANCRFINSDSYASTGQGIPGTNMFVYCLNNPVCMRDGTGSMSSSSIEIGWWEWLVNLIGSGLTVSANPYAIAFSGLFVVGAALVMYIPAITITPSESDEDTTRSASDYLVDIEAQLPDTASRYGKFKCKEAAKAMQMEMVSNNYNGYLISIQYSGLGSRNYVWSDSSHDVISLNGYHCGILYNGIVYCNVHPFGLAEQEWLNDFVGLGERYVQKIPF